MNLADRLDEFDEYENEPPVPQEGEGAAAPKSGPMSPYYEGIIQALLKTTQT